MPRKKHRSISPHIARRLDPASVTKEDAIKMLLEVITDVDETPKEELTPQHLRAKSDAVRQIWQIAKIGASDEYEDLVRELTRKSNRAISVTESGRKVDIFTPKKLEATVYEEVDADA